ncbi:MAG: hypothetical protein LBU51_03175 [Bacteroidales bacterium]|jgi:hypothetical protein|nr:hypothetical protein [Bacteroidales bacterium]
MSNTREIARQIRSLAQTNGFETYACKVVSVDGATCSVSRVMDEMKIEGVRMNGTITEDDGLVIVPEQDSDVLITNIDDNQWFVSQYSKIEKIILHVKDKIEINGGDNDGMVKIKELTDKLNGLKDVVNGFVNTYNAHTHICAVPGSASATPVAPQTQTAQPFNKSDYENDKIVH